MSLVAFDVEREGLTTATLSVLSEYVTSGSRDWSKYYASSGAIFIRTQDINQNRLSLGNVAYVQLPARVEGKRSLVQKGDLLITITGANVGRVAVVEQELPEAYVSQSVCLVRLKDPSLAKFVQLQLIARRGDKSALEAMAYGLGRPVLNLENVRSAPVKIGPPRMCNEIVAEIEKQFSRLDEAVANLKRVKANLKHYKAAVLRAAVEGRFGSVRGVAHGDTLPVGWRWTTVGELASVGTGTTPARSNEAFYRGGTIPWITSAAVNEPYVDGADQFVTKDALLKTNLTLYPAGTLLVAMYGEGKTRGKCSELRIAATTNQALAALQADAARRPWLKLFLEQNYDNTRRIASGGVQPNLNLGLLRAIRLPLPPADDQQRIVAEVDRRLSIVREAEAEVDASLNRAQALRQAILQTAFAFRDASETMVVA